MRLGVYGGSFNPPHTGHALAAAELIEKLALDRLLIIPAADLAQLAYLFIAIPMDLD